MPPIVHSLVFRTTIAATLCWVAEGCTTKSVPLRRGEHAIRVNATASAPVQPGTAFVVTPPRRDPGAESSLLYAETARLVKGALMAKGLYEAPDSAHARVIVEVEYSMETPRVSRAAPDPAGQRGTPPRGTEIPDEALNARSTQRGPLEKNLVLTAREARPAGGGVPRTLWSVEVSTTDNSNDLRKYLPILAASAIDHMGTDSDGPKTVRISETDKSVTLIRQSK